MHVFASAGFTNENKAQNENKRRVNWKKKIDVATTGVRSFLSGMFQ